MGIGGIFLAYLGALTRFLFNGGKKPVNYYFLGSKDHDLSKHWTDSVLNKLIGMAVLIALMCILGYLTTL